MWSPKQVLVQTSLEKYPYFERIQTKFLQNERHCTLCIPRCRINAVTGNWLIANIFATWIKGVVVED
jgi:hypothetical protein